MQALCGAEPRHDGGRGEHEQDAVNDNDANHEFRFLRLLTSNDKWYMKVYVLSTNCLLILYVQEVVTLQKKY